MPGKPSLWLPTLLYFIRACVGKRRGCCPLSPSGRAKQGVALAHIQECSLGSPGQCIQKGLPTWESQEDTDLLPKDQVGIKIFECHWIQNPGQRLAPSNALGLPDILGQPSLPQSKSQEPH